MDDLQRLDALLFTLDQQAKGILRHRVTQEDRENAVAHQSSIRTVELHQVEPDDRHDGEPLLGVDLRREPLV